MPNYWLSYVSVPNVDQVATNTSHAGGRVLQAPTDLPGIGRNAILVDPQGAIFAIMRADQGDAPVRETPDIGEFCWEQLRTPHPEAAASFYRAALGWHNMPAEGAPDEMMFLAGKEQAASAVKAPAGVPPNWLTYVVVQKAVDTAARAAKLGGQVLMGEVPVPNMGVMAIVSDPLGSVIGLFEPRNE
jgi:predicted enzyme related to lactoylglutathione lyase